MNIENLAANYREYAINLRREFHRFTVDVKEELKKSCRFFKV